MTETDLKQIHERIIREIELHGGRIDRIYYCTALVDGAYNRNRVSAWRYTLRKSFLILISIRRL